MIPTPPRPLHPAGTLVRVTQFVRVGHRRWLTTVTGTVEDGGLRPVGGMEMGGKALYCHQPTLKLRLDDGEVTVVALDDDTRVEAIGAAVPAETFTATTATGEPQA
jgi:hypothetical protein